MARVTVEDCIKFVPNRFELVIMSANRARQLARGAQSELQPERDKNTVLALREIGEGVVNPQDLLLMDEMPPILDMQEEEEEMEAIQEARSLMDEETHLPGVVEEEELEEDELLPANDLEEPVGAEE